MHWFPHFSPKLGAYSSCGCLQTSADQLKFGEDLADYMEKNINSTVELVLTGYFNIHVNDKSNSDFIIFNDILDSFSLINHVSFLTHRLQNLLNLVMTQANSNIITNASQGRLFSDHNYIFYNAISVKHLVSSHISATRKIRQLIFQPSQNIFSMLIQDVDLTELNPGISIFTTKQCPVLLISMHL